MAEKEQYNNVFAPVYNKYWGPLMAENFYKLISSLIDISECKSVLDLCCGTGQLSALISKDYPDINYYGVDLSNDMLSFARQNAPTVKFSQQNACNFTIEGQKFDLIYSMFDSLNHILSSDDLLKVFISVREHLSHKGKFIFDFNTPQAFLDADSNTYSFVDDETATIVSTSYDVGTMLLSYKLTIFNKNDNDNGSDSSSDNSWMRHDLSMQEKAYTDRVVIKLLQKAGFENITPLDFTSGEHLHESGENDYLALLTGRIVILAF